jgi:DNA-directed RNA polymerase specialized sigma24 family protein
VADADIELLLPLAVGGDERAWGQLWTELEPRLGAIVRKPRFAGRLSRSEDDVRNILVEVMARLRDDDFRRLRRYLDQKADKPKMTFMPWLIVVTKRIAIDYLRAHADYIDKRRDQRTESPGKWVEHGTLPSDSRLDGGRPPVTTRGTALAMLRYAYDALPPEQVSALELWILNKGFKEIAEELGLATAKDAERLLRAALERLRRQFREKAGEPEP